MGLRNLAEYQEVVANQDHKVAASWVGTFWLRKREETKIISRTGKEGFEESNYSNPSGELFSIRYAIYLSSE